MTVTSTASVKQYTGNTSTTAFSFPYKAFNTTDFIVTILNSSTLAVTTQVNGGSGTYDYSVAIASDKNSATITFNNAPLSAHKITIERKMSLVQSNDYTPNDNFPAETHEQALDERTLMVQQVQNSYELNTFRFDKNVTDAGVVAINKTVAERANKFLSFDAAGDLISTQEIGTHRGNWASAAAYNVRDLVKDASNSNVYICIVAHTSSGSTPISSNTDVAKWTLIIDAAAASTSATAAATSATAAAGSASTATTQAGIATTQAGIATAKAVLTASDATDTAADLVETAADVVLAEAAKVAAEAATGAMAWKYTFDTSTSMADPGTGDIRFDNATLASVTNIAIDATSADTGNPDVSDLIASIDDGTNSTHEGYIFVRKSGTPGTFMAYNVTGAIVDNTGWLQIPVTHAASAGSLSGSDVLYISFARSGNVGATGSTGPTGPTGSTGPTGPGNSGFHYQFDTDTADSDQGAGKIWLNHGTVASATILYIDDDDNDGTDISAFVATWDDSSATSDKGFIKIQARATPTDYAVFKIGAVGTDGTAYWKFPVVHQVSAGTLSNTEVVDVFFTRSGDSGGVANRTVDTMTGDNSDDTLSLSQIPASENNVTITLDGVTQHHDTYSLAGSTITFSTAPGTGVKVEAVSGGNENIGTPSDNTVTLAKMQVNSIDSDQYVDGSIDLVHLSATGTAGSGNFLRGDNSWQTAGGSS